MHNLIEMAGTRWGRLTVLEQAGRTDKGVVIWRCRCDCGSDHAVSGVVLRAGKSTSCGCAREEIRTLLLAKGRTKHGEGAPSAESPEFRSWRHMIDRCTNPRNHAFERYGGRGIRVCDRWISSYSSFLADMGRKPTPKHTIDRINNDGNYEPENCRWASILQQASNRSDNVWLKVNDELMILSDAVRRFTKLTNSAVAGRLHRGKSIRYALGIPDESRITVEVISR